MYLHAQRGPGIFWSVIVLLSLILIVSNISSASVTPKVAAGSHHSLALKRKGNEVAEAVLWNGILIWKQTGNST